MKNKNETNDMANIEWGEKESEAFVATIKEIDRLQKLAFAFALINIPLILWILLTI